MLMLIRMAGVGLTFLATVLITRALGIEGFGRYAFLFAIVSLASLPTQFGMPVLVVRETAKAAADGALDQLRALLTWAHWFLLGSSILVVGAILIWTQSARPEDFGAMAIACLLVPLIALGALRGAILRGFGHDLLGQFPEHAIRPFLFVGGLVLCMTLGLGLSVAQVFAVQAVATGLATGIGVVILWWRAPPLPKAARLPGQMSKWWKALFFMGATSGLVVINSSVDVIMLGAWSNDAEVGRYRLAATVAALFTLGLQTMNTFAMPYLSRHLHAKDWTALRNVVQRSAQLSFAFACAGFGVVLLIGAPGLAWIFGAGFGTAFSVLLILAVGHLLNAFFGPVTDVLMMQGAERLVALVALLSTCTNVALNVALIPRYGAEGAAVAASAAIILSRVILFVMVWRRVTLRSWPVPL